MEPQILIITTTVGILIGAPIGFLIQAFISARRNRRISITAWQQAADFYRLKNNDLRL
jgi:hypothetical protein